MKFLATAITGTTVIGGTAAPFAYVEVTRPQHQTLWKKKLNNTEPIITCKDYDAEYKVEMAFAVQGDKSLGLGITFQLLRKKGSYWKKEGGEEKSWTNIGKEGNWGFRKDSWRSKSGDVTVWYREGSRGWWKEAKSCNEKIEWREKNTRTIWKEIKDIKGGFETNNCKKGLFTMTCEINFGSESHLTWRNNYKPTITYSAF